MALKIILMFIIAYLLGGINFSIIISRLVKKQDVRELGSGNAGFTNVLRNYGKGLAAIVFVGDILKTIAAIVISWVIADSAYVTYAAGLGVILGHNFPLFYGFKGGKGILTTISTIVLMEPIPGLILIPLSVGIMFLTGYVSLGSIFICLYFPVVMLILHPNDIPLIIFAFVVCCLGIYMHRGNIKRLLSGTENRFERKKKNG